MSVSWQWLISLHRAGELHVSQEITLKITKSICKQRMHYLSWDAHGPTNTVESIVSPGSSINFSCLHPKAFNMRHALIITITFYQYHTSNGDCFTLVFRRGNCGSPVWWSPKHRVPVPTGLTISETEYMSLGKSCSCWCEVLSSILVGVVSGRFPSNGWLLFNLNKTT